jgi:hypothetical protein
MRRTTVGAARVCVTVLNRAKRNATVSVSLRQQGAAVIQVLGLFGNLERRDPSLWNARFAQPPADLREDPRPLPIMPKRVVFDDRVDDRLVTITDNLVESWMAHSDSRPIDWDTLPAFADYATAGAWYACIQADADATDDTDPMFKYWFPTYTLEVIFHSPPPANLEFVRMRLQTPISVRGVYQEDIELWAAPPNAPANRTTRAAATVSFASHDNGQAYTDGLLLLSARRLSTIVSWQRNVKLDKSTADTAKPTSAPIKSAL